MFYKNKKYVSLSGTVLLPLKIGTRATIFSSEGVIRTSIVDEIKQVKRDSVIFETQNSVYRIAHHLSPEPAAMAANADILYACA